MLNMLLLCYICRLYPQRELFHRIIWLGINRNIWHILLFDFSIFAQSVHWEQNFICGQSRHVCPRNYPSFCHIHCRIYCHIYGVAISRRWAVTKLAVFPADHCSNNSSCPWSQSLAGSFKQFIQIVSEQTRNSFTEKKSYYFLFCYFILVTPWQDL